MSRRKLQRGAPRARSILLWSISGGGDRTASAKFATLPGPVSPGLPAVLLARRLFIMAAEHRVLAAFRTEEAARLALLPAISLNFEGGRKDFSSESIRF